MDCVVAAAEGPAKIELSVSKGTEFCESCRRPSKEANRKVLSFCDGEADVAAVLLAAERILDGSADGSGVEIGEGRDHCARAELKANGSRASMRIVAEKAIDRAMHVVGAGLGDNVDGSAGGSAQVGGVVTAIDLEFLHIILVDGQANAAAVA